MMQQQHLHSLLSDGSQTSQRHFINKHAQREPLSGTTNTSKKMFDRLCNTSRAQLIFSETRNLNAVAGESCEHTAQ